jgi:tetratricopeptide (TPR) repeat protein
MSITPFAYLALVGWPLVVTVLFALMPGRKAVTIAVIGAWLCLPPYTLPINGLPDYSKSVAASLGMLAGTLLFAPDRLLHFRPRWFDMPMLGWCLCGMLSSLSNDLGIYDGLSSILTQVVLWGLPYLLGRLYFVTLDDLRVFVVGMVIGGLSFIPLCLGEIGMSPQLLKTLYGYSVDMGMRDGFYRPQVFFLTVLELGMWMTAASLAAWWLWRCRTLRTIGGSPFGPLMLLLIITTFASRSTGALVLLIVGVPLLWLSARWRTRLLLAALLLVGPVYVSVRITETWSGWQAVVWANRLVGPVRAETLGYRFQCERYLGDHALERPIFGWGGFGRGLVANVPVDGLWIGTLGANGFVGLILLYLALVLPAARFVWHFPARWWGDPRVAAASLAAACLGLYLVDCLMNAFVNIIYISLAGALAGIDPRELRALGASGAAGTGRRADGRTSLAVRHARVTPASGRALLADRCRTLGRSFKLDGRLDEADAAWRQALDLIAAQIEAEPGAVEPRRRWCDCANDLAWLRANRPEPSRRDPASAVSLAGRAVDEFPDAAAYWNTLGAASYRAGDDRTAIAALERARSIAGGTAFDEVFLAMARARMGDPEGARQALARAMLQAEQHHPGHPELAALCDEAHSLIGGGATAPAVVG